jgi:hypothetical protein
MGTSSPYGGHKDSNPLLPPDYDGDNDAPDNGDTAPDMPPAGPQPPLPPKDTPWKDVKTAMSYYITGRTSSGGSGVNHVIRSYGRAAGSTAGMMRTSSSGIRTGQVLTRFLSNSYDTNDSVFNKINTILQSETEIKTALSKIANVISPVPEGKGDAVTREAITDTLCQLYDYMDTNHLDISNLRDLDSALQEQLLTTYVSEYIWGRMLNDLQICFERHAKTPERVAEVEKDFRDYIYAKVSVEVHKGADNPQANLRFDVEKIFHECYEVLML